MNNSQSLMSQADIWLKSARHFFFVMIGFSIPLSTAGVSISFGMLFILWLIDRNFAIKFQAIRSNPVFVAVLAFFALHVVGLTWLEAPEPVNGFKSWMLFLIPVLATAVDTKTARRGVYAFVIAMMIAESYVYANILANWEAYINMRPMTPLIDGRLFISGSRVSYNPMLAFAIALLLTTLLAGYYKKGFRRGVAIFFLLTMVANMFMTEGRAGHVAFIFVWLVLSVYFLRGRWLAMGGMIMSLVVILGLAFAYSPVFKARVLAAQNDILRYQEHTLIQEDTGALGTSVGVRLHYTEQTVRQGLNRPLMGYGTGSFEHIYAQRVAAYPGEVRPATNPHNHHALIFLQFGLIGLLVYLGMYATQLWTVRTMPQAYEYRALALLLPLFYGLINMYDTYFWGHQLQALFAFLASVFYRQDMWAASADHSGPLSSEAPVRKGHKIANYLQTNPA